MSNIQNSNPDFFSLSWSFFFLKKIHVSKKIYKSYFFIFKILYGLN